MDLQDKVSALKGIGEKKSRLLRNMKIETVEDLLLHFPRKYEDRRHVSYIMEAPFDRTVRLTWKYCFSTEDTWPIILISAQNIPFTVR